MRKMLIMLGLVIATMAQSTGFIMAQEHKRPTLDDLVSGGATYRITEDIYGLQWWGDVCVKPGIDQLVAVDPKTGRETTLTTRQDIINIIKTECNMANVSLSHLHNVKLPWPGQTRLLVRLPQAFMVVDWTKHTVVRDIELPRGAANADFSNSGLNVAYTVGNNLFVNDKQLSNEPDGILVGQSVHRNEFGIHKGTFWSPKGDLLAFYRMDESMVSNYPLVDIDQRVGELNNVRYPMAGMTSHKVQVGIYNTASGQTVYLNTGDPTDRYFTNISWAPDQQSLYLIELNRDQNHAKLCQYDAASGKLVKVLFEERNPKYVEPQNPIVFLPWDSCKFIYLSQKDGFRHMYLMDTEGRELKQLTKGEWLVQSLIGFNEKAHEVYYASTEVSSQRSNLYQLNVDNGRKTLISNAEGVHSGALSASGTYLIDRYSTPQVPRNIDLYNTKGKKKELSLLKAEDPLKDFEMPIIETGTLKAADGKTDLVYRVIKPADFDPNKKYPAIVYVYGGPHAHNIQDSWRYYARAWDLYMASLGYVMFTVDNRGSENRGFEFESATFRQLGVEECKDQVKGVEWLKSQPYIDGNRIGVHGWSFGGHMTTALKLRYPDLFKVAVAGGPVIDWSFYEVMYGERYMDTPQTNPEGYKATNLRNLASNLKGKLLLIHGYQDDTCVPQHTLSFIKACVDARVYPDLFLYPGHKHNVSGRDRIHLNTKITEYFVEHL